MQQSMHFVDMSMAGMQQMLEEQINISLFVVKVDIGFTSCLGCHSISSNANDQGELHAHYKLFQPDVYFHLYGFSGSLQILTVISPKGSSSR